MHYLIMYVIQDLHYSRNLTRVSSENKNILIKLRNKSDLEKLLTNYKTRIKR